MAKGPKGQRRPTDLNQRALAIIRIATGELADESSPAPNRAKGGKVGGRHRAKKLSPERRREIAAKAAAARWNQRRS